MSKRTTELSVKTTPVLADTMTGLDSEDTNLSTKDKVFTIESIGDTIFPDKTTDNLTEGASNLYYTDDRVDVNTTVVGKADKSNVIEKDSTTPYTPTLGTHPVNKDYADNMSIPDATESAKGKIAIANTSEVDLRIDDTKAITPSKLSDGLQNQVGINSIFSEGVNIQATQNGIIHGFAYNSSGSSTLGLVVFSDNTTTPVVAIYRDNVNVQALGYSGMCVPIKKGNYYRVERQGGDSSTLYFTPLS